MKEINKPIKMYAWFKLPTSTKDKFTADVHLIDPIRLITINDEGEEIEVKIENIVKRDVLQSGKETILRYICSIVLYDRKIQCEIHYNVNTMQWVLKRM
jgi:hypothetical protein